MKFWKYVIIVFSLMIVLLLFAEWFIHVYCFFPALQTQRDMGWFLTREGKLVGINRRQQLDFKNSNPLDFKSYCPIVLYEDTNVIKRFNSRMNSGSFFYCIENIDRRSGEILDYENIETGANEGLSYQWNTTNVIAFTKNIGKSRPIDYSQPNNNDYDQTSNQLIFLINDSPDLSSDWYRKVFDYYPEGDSYLLCWEYSPVHHGCFLLFEVYSKKCNELLYYDFKTHQVSAVNQIHGYKKEFQCFRILSDQKSLVTYNKDLVEFYSLPDLTFLKEVSHPGMRLDYRSPVAVSNDHQYIAFSFDSCSVFLFDLNKNDLFVLDDFHYNKINMSQFYYTPKSDPTCNLYKNVVYEIQQLCFYPDKEDVLLGLNFRGDYYEWDVVKRERILHKELFIPKKEE